MGQRLINANELEDFFGYLSLSVFRGKNQTSL